MQTRSFRPWRGAVLRKAMLRGVMLSGAVLLEAMLLSALLLSLWLPIAAHAHPLAPIALTIEQHGTELHASVKRARVQKRGAHIEPRFPRRCAVLGARRVEERAAYVMERYRLRCEGPIVGSRFGVDGLDEAGVDAVVRIVLDDGREVQGLLDHAADALVVPARASTVTTMRAYGRAGVLHLLGGLDHVLFVLGLTLLLRRRRRVLLALTAFTAGHGLSMCAAALGWIALPSRLAEAAIAVTLVWLGYRLLRPLPQTLSMTRPYAASLGVGLIHGLGFASAFDQAGLSGAELFKALGCFHVGIELGQLLVVLAALLIMHWLARRNRIAAADRAARQMERYAEVGSPSSRARSGLQLSTVTMVAGYVIGSLSVMWLIERALGMG